MVIATSKFESLLVDAIESKNEHQFGYIINVLRVNPEQKQQCLNDLSIFEKVLRTPGCIEFIELCIKRGCNLAQKNSQEIYPLQYAVESLSSENLKTFLEAFDRRHESWLQKVPAINLGFELSSSDLHVNEDVKIPIEEENVPGKKSEAVEKFVPQLLTNIDILRSLILRERHEADNCQTSICRTVHFDEIFKALIVNEMFEGGNNYLHILVDQLTDENYVEVCAMIKLMLAKKCNPNLPNEQLATPFFLLLKKLARQDVRSDLIEFFLDHTSVDLYSYRSEEIIKFMDECGLRHRILLRSETVNTMFMNNLLEEWSEKKFVDQFEAFVAQNRTASAFKNDLSMLLEAAIARNFKEAVQTLLVSGVDVNAICRGSKFNVLPAFVACHFGHYDVLRILLREASVSFKSGKKSLLQEICLPGKIHLTDRQKCFELIIADPRCTVEIINAADDRGYTPMFHACHCRFDGIAIELLRRGAFVGHASVVNKITSEVLKEFLDECIKCSDDIRDKNCEIHVDYRFLTPPEDGTHLEVQSIQAIVMNPKLKELTLHPVISSYLNIKWRKINWLVYFNLLAYFFFMIFLGNFIINFFHVPIFNEPTKNVQTSPVSYTTNIPLYIPYAAKPWNSSFALAPVSTTRAPVSTTFELSEDYGGEDYVYDENNEDYDEKIYIRRPHQNQTTTTTARTTTPQPPSSSFEKPGPLDILLTLFGLKTRLAHERSKRDIHQAMKINLEDYLLKHRASYLICLLGVFLVIIYETAQFFLSYEKYFFKIGNWLDIVLILLSLTVLLFNSYIPVEDFKKIRAITVLVMAAQTIQLVAKVSFLSMSLHMAIFKRVCKTFLKTIALYLILILAFAMSFYTLNDDGTNDLLDSTNSNSDNNNYVEDESEKDEKVFANAFISVITIVRMMLSDFENIKINRSDHFQGFMFLLFVILITVVLFNLLNALAISDTNQIMKDAELVNMKKRIMILYAHEKFFAMLKLSFANIFPKYSFISFTPNKSNKIKFESTDNNSNFKSASRYETIDIAVRFLESKGFIASVNNESLQCVVQFVESAQLKNAETIKIF